MLEAMIVGLILRLEPASSRSLLDKSDVKQNVAPQGNQKGSR